MEEAAAEAAPAAEQPRSGGLSRGGPDVTWQQVLMALAFLMVFGLSFAVAFEYYGQAKVCLEADIDGPANCTLRRVQADGNVSCASGAIESSPCYSVFVDVVYAATFAGVFSASAVRNDCLLLDSYYSFYSTAASSRCSYTLCGGRPGERRPSADAAAGRHAFPCWVDAGKAGVAFVELQDERTNRHFFSRPEAYAVAVAPPLGMGLSVLAVVCCIAAGKVRAGELLQPIVTPNHVEIGGKWYLRSPRASPVEPEDKWQHLKEALQ